MTIRTSSIYVAIFSVIVLASGTACEQRSTSDVSANANRGVPGFTEVARAAGINHSHSKPILDDKLNHIMSWVASVGAAAAAGDFNNDGWIDLYVTNSKKGTPNYLYRNDGDGTFTEIARRAGVAEINNDDGTSMDCIWGDYNNDGWSDLYVVRWGTDILFRNNGDGTFANVTEDLFRTKDNAPGIDWANGNAAIFFDYNKDGLLDVYVGNYFRDVDLWHLKSTKIMHNDFEKARNGGRNALYRQEPDGSFVELAASLGLDDPGWTLAVGSADLNNDGWPDLYCADDFGPDQLFVNNGDGTFENETESAIDFDTKKGMNVDFGDFNGDGWLDIYVANITTAEYLQEGNMLWHNNGPADAEGITLTDVSLETATYDGGWGWGAKFLDFDNDADLDIVALNGFISAGEGNYWYDLASWTVTDDDSGNAANWPAIGNRSFSGYEATRLFVNEGEHIFTERAKQWGLGSQRDGRGVVPFDYDNDGRLDLFVANQGQKPELFRNDAPLDNHWLIVNLETDSTTNVTRDAVGARITAVTASGRQIRERDGGNGYSGQADPRLHFGLGKDSSVSLLEVRWPDGGLQYLENVEADQILTIRQDPGSYVPRSTLVLAKPAHWVRTEAAQVSDVIPLDPEELKNRLAEMEDKLRNGATGYGPASVYRKFCASHDQHERAIKFFKKRLVDSPDDLNLRIELACAYVDKIATCGGLAAIVSKGTLARKSLDQLDTVLAQHTDLWVGHYTRGMNHLHWPRALRHSDDAAADLETCRKLQLESGDQKAKPYYVRTYIALGDAYTKAKEYDKAREAWKDGLAVFPETVELHSRLAIAENKSLLAFVEDKRNLQQPVDTDLSFLDRTH